VSAVRSHAGEAGGRWALEVEGTIVGAVVSAEGGDISAPVIRDGPTADAFVHKRLGPPHFESITVQVGLGLAKSFYQWIADAWAGKALAHDGAVLSLDATGRVLTRRQFKNAHIVSTAVPALDGASRSDARLTVRIAPERTDDVKGTGKVVLGTKASAQKRWLPSNFRLEIEGLETSRVRRVEALTVATGVLDPPTVSTTIDFPDMRLTMVETGAAHWQAWLRDFVSKGGGAAAGTKHGTLTLFGSDAKTKLAAIGFDGLGLRRLEQVVSGSATRRSELVADLFCERMTFAVAP